MRKIRVAFGICLLIWALMLFVGVDLYQGVVAQKVPGYPKSGQLRLYVLFPGVMVVLNIVALIFLRVRWWGLALILSAQFFAFLTTFFLMGGGV